MKDETPVNFAMPEWLKWKATFENWMEKRGLTAYGIDEIAIMFTSEKAFYEFITAAIAGEGVKAFNSAKDFVRTRPLESEYVVQYVFLEDGMKFLRVEAMYLPPFPHNHSPLHAARANLLSEEDTNVGIHMSFKCSSMDDYSDVCDVLMEVDDAHLAQSCISTYGQFSYFHIDGITDECGLYLKPRVNQRDDSMIPAPPVAPLDEEDADRGEFGMPTLGLGGL